MGGCTSHLSTSLTPLTWIFWMKSSFNRDGWITERGVLFKFPKQWISLAKAKCVFKTKIKYINPIIEMPKLHQTMKPFSKYKSFVTRHIISGSNWPTKYAQRGEAKNKLRERLKIWAREIQLCALQFELNKLIHQNAFLELLSEPKSVQSKSQPSLTPNAGLE